MSDTALAAIVSGLMSGGLIGALVAAYSARQKVPVERDSIAVTGAETAVLALQHSLSAETKRADRAEATLAKRDARIEILEQKLDELQAALNGARAELQQILFEAKKGVDK